MYLFQGSFTKCGKSGKEAEKASSAAELPSICILLLNWTNDWVVTFEAFVLHRIFVILL